MSETRLKSKGQRKLREALADRGAARALAKQLNVSPSVVSRWLDGRQKPTTKTRFELMEIHQEIEVLSWDEPDDAAGSQELQA